MSRIRKCTGKAIPGARWVGSFLGSDFEQFEIETGREQSANMSAKKLVYQISTALIVLLFTFSGVMKLTPLISPEIHEDMVRNKLVCGQISN